MVRRLPPSATAYRAGETPWDRSVQEKGPLGEILSKQRRLTVGALKGRTINNLIDLGCGTGEVLDELIRLPGIKKAMAVDVNEAAMKVAMQRIGKNPMWQKVDFLEADLQQLGLGGRTFDAAVCLDVLSEVPDVASTLGAVHRLLKPGGFFVTNFVARERSDELVRTRHGWLKFLMLKARFTAGLLCSFNEDLFSRFGRTGIVRLMPYTREDSTALVSPLFRILRTDSDFYHWFLLEKPK